MSIPPELAKMAELAKTALDAQIWGRRAEANRAVQAIVDLPQENAIVGAALAWCDTAIQLVPGWKDAAGKTARVVLREETGLNDVPIPPGVTWAVDLIAARAADDQEAFSEIMYERCTTDDQFSQCINDLLILVATNLRPVFQAARQVRASRPG